MEGADLIERGMVFNSLGAARAKAQSPLSLRFVHRTARSPRLDDLGVLEVE